MLVKDQYQFKLIKKVDGDKPPRNPTLRQLIMDLSTRINQLEKIVVQDHNLLTKIINLNNLRTK